MSRSRHIEVTAALATAGMVAATALALRERRRRLAKASPRLLELKDLCREEVPARLRPDFYFDFEAHPFEHAELIRSAHDVVEVLGSIHAYAVEWIQRNTRACGSSVLHDACRQKRTVGKPPAVFLEADAGDIIFEPDVLIGASSASASNSSAPDDAFGLHVSQGCLVLGGTFDLRSGGIWLGADVVVDPGVHIAGPAIIGQGTHLRPGAYLRGDVIIGKKAVLRGELKNSVIMDEAELCHPGYAGDSIIGWKGHFGCQSLTANLGLFGSVLALTLPGAAGEPPSRYSLGRRKVGLMLGDECQLGCSTVTDPGTFIGPRTYVYPLTRLAAGVYGPDMLVKNKPEEAGAIICEALRKRSKS